MISAEKETYMQLVGYSDSNSCLYILLCSSTTSLDYVVVIFPCSSFRLSQQFVGQSINRIVMDDDKWLHHCIDKAKPYPSGLSFLSKDRSSVWFTKFM